MVPDNCQNIDNEVGKILSLLLGKGKTNAWLGKEGNRQPGIESERA